MIKTKKFCNETIQLYHSLHIDMIVIIRKTNIFIEQVITFVLWVMLVLNAWNVIYIMKEEMDPSAELIFINAHSVKTQITML